MGGGGARAGAGRMGTCEPQLGRFVVHKL